MTINIHWFRQDLRISDNPALFEAAKSGKVLPIYILDDENTGEYKMGGASRVWLHHSLKSLNESLGGKLKVFKGNPEEIIEKIFKISNAESIYWNRCYENWRIVRDKKIKDKFDAKTFNGSLLWEPWEILKDDGTPYKVFTPYYKRACAAIQPRIPLPTPNLDIADINLESDDLELLPNIPWHKNMLDNWQVGEEGAKATLGEFLDNRINGYKEGRNFPAQNHTSYLSSYLHFGEISPNQVWHAARFKEINQDIENFCFELGWREFSYNMLYYFPNLPKQNMQSKFDNFPWENNPKLLQAWKNGMTGYPIIDAGMRELWQTGYMHNRVRMVVASFLVKNLLIHWHEGQSWFWGCLFDADLANNSASWQWVAGCGADAAPYFRIFNPITQGQKFDPDGEYTKKYVPELANMPKKHLFNPWDASEKVLRDASVELGKTYPWPIVDVKASRNRALEAYKQI